MKRIKEKRNKRVEVEEDDESFINNTNLLQADFPELINNDPSYASYISVLADMLHFVPESRLSAVQALGKFRNLFTHMPFNFSASEFNRNFPELAFLQSLNLTKFSSDVTFSNFEKTIRRYSGVSSTIEVMSAPDRIYVPDEFTKPPNSHVMHMGMKAVKSFVEEELKAEPGFLEFLLNDINESNQTAAKTSFLEQFKALLPFTWSEEKVQTWLYEKASEHHARNPETKPIFNCNNCESCPVLSLLGKGLNGSFMFSPQINSIETASEPARCTRNCCSNKITETHKNFMLAMVQARLQEFFNLHGFEMGLLSGWQSEDWFPIDEVDFVVTGSSDEEARLDGSYQRLLTHFLKMEEKVAWSFKMRVSTEANADVVYFVFSYPPKG